MNSATRRHIHTFTYEALLIATTLTVGCTVDEAETKRPAVIVARIYAVVENELGNALRADGGNSLRKSLTARDVSYAPETFDLVDRTRRFYRTLRLLADAYRLQGAIQKYPRVQLKCATLLHRMPNENTNPIALLERGAWVTPLRRNGKFVCVMLDDGTIGWLQARALPLIPRSLKANVHTIESKDSRHPFVSSVLRVLGIPYRWGGNSKRGVDCSGLVQLVAKRFGLNLPHSAESLFRMGIPVARNELQPGDLVFFKDTYKKGISHVGVYIGHGKFVHASSKRGIVTMDNLATPYYHHRYAGARRLILQ